MPGFFDNIANSWGQANAWAEQQLNDPGFFQKTMEEALNFAPMGITAYHATGKPIKGNWKPNTHFGTAQAALSRLLQKYTMTGPFEAEYLAKINPEDIPDLTSKLRPLTTKGNYSPVTYPVDIDLLNSKVLSLTDEAANSPWDAIKELKNINKINDYEYTILKNKIDKHPGSEKEIMDFVFDYLKKSKGYDVIEYSNRVEDVGSKSYVVLNPKKVKSFFESQAKRGK